MTFLVNHPPRNHSDPLSYKVGGQKRTLVDLSHTVGFMKLPNNVALPIWKEKPSFWGSELDDYRQHRERFYGPAEVALHLEALVEPMELVEVGHLGGYALLHPAPLTMRGTPLTQDEALAEIEGVIRVWFDYDYVVDHYSGSGFPPVRTLMDRIREKLVMSGAIHAETFSGVQDAHLVPSQDRVMSLIPDRSSGIGKPDWETWVLPDRWANLACIKISEKSQDPPGLTESDLPREVTWSVAQISVAFRQAEAIVWHHFHLRRSAMYDTRTGILREYRASSGVYIDVVEQGDFPNVRPLPSRRSVEPPFGYSYRDGFGFPLRRIGYVPFPSRAVKVLHGFGLDDDGYLTTAGFPVSGAVETAKLAAAYQSAADRVPESPTRRALADMATGLASAPPLIHGLVPPAPTSSRGDLWATRLGKEAEDSKSRQMVRDVIVDEGSEPPLTLGALDDRNAEEFRRRPLLRALGIFDVAGAITKKQIGSARWVWSSTDQVFHLQVPGHTSNILEPDWDQHLEEGVLLWTTVPADVIPEDDTVASWLEREHPKVFAHSIYSDASGGNPAMDEMNEYSLPYCSSYYVHPLGGINPEKASTAELRLLITAQGSDFLEAAVATHLLGVYGWAPGSSSSS